MKKKSFLNGINAKMALAIVALSGALFTGCYKDDGLDADSSTGNVTLPNPTYTIVGNVIDAETLQPIVAGNVTGGATATITDGGFSVNVPKEGPYALTVTSENYVDANVTVDVKKVAAGQSAVYTTFVAMVHKYTGLYTIEVKATGENGQALEDVVVGITNMDGATINNGALLGGNSYIVKLSKEGYINKFITVELPKARVNTIKVITASMSKVITQKVRIHGEIILAGKLYNAKSIKLINKDGKLLGIDEGYTYSFEVDESEFTKIVPTRAAKETETRTAVFTIKIIDQNNATISFEKTFTIVTSEDGSIIPGEGETESPIEFKINVTPTQEPNSAWTVTNNMIIDICNDEMTELSYKFQYKKYTGAEDVVAESNYIAKLAEANLTSGDIFDAVVGLIEKAEANGINYTLVDSIGKIPAQQLLKSFDIKHNYNKAVYTLESITVDGQEVQDFVKAFGAKRTLKVAIEKPDFTNYIYTDISHSHGHGHGHGDNQNAGGGIIESE